MKSHPQKYRKGITFALVNMVGLGILGIFDKIGASQATNPFFFSTQSVFFAFLTVGLFAMISARRSFLHDLRKTSLPTWGLVLLIGLCTAGIANALRMLGLTQSTGTFATLAQIFITALTAIFAMIFLRERLTARFWMLFVVMILATYFVSVGKLTLTAITQGDTYILLGGAFIAVANIISKFVLNRTTPLVLSFGRQALGGLFLVATSISVFQNSQALGDITIWAVLSGIFWALTTTCYYFAMKHLGVTLATSILMIAPVETMILEYVFLKQPFTQVQIVAAFVVIVSGMLMVATKQSPKPSGR
jgi:drug/metabolite transporter (DMT)-like permease